MRKIIPLLKKNTLLMSCVLFIVVLQLPLIWPLFHAGYFPNHDDVQVVRVFEIYQSIKFGDFPPRWSAGLLYGHGYPLFIFYAPFVYLIAALFVLFGATFLTATKLTFILSFMLGGLGMFLLVRQLWGNWSGVVAASIYSFFPYRSVDIYVRGNVAEFFAYSFLPTIVWINVKIFQAERKLLWSLILGVLLGILILSHNISTFIYAQFLTLFNLFMIFSFIKKNRLEHIKYLFISIFFALSISSFFWIPLLLETQYVRVGEFSEYPYFQYFVTLGQLWDSPWGYGGFILENPMSLQFGKVALVISLLTFLLNAYFKTKYQKLLFFFVGILVFFSFMETRFSEIIWKSFSEILSYMQFPWRYHIVTTFAAAILGGGFIYLVSEYLKKKNRYILFTLGILIILFSIWENVGYFKPEKYTDNPSVSETTTWNDEYLPNWVKAKPKDYAPDKVRFIEGAGEVSSINWGYLQKDFVVKTASPSALEVAHIYYLGWVAKVDGKDTMIDYKNDTGLMRVNVPEGEHLVSFAFQRTSWRLISEVISLVSLLILLVLIVFSILEEDFLRKAFRKK
jgi:hypothetical protein